MLKLTANPTFRVKVEIPAPGGQKHTIELDFKHKTKTEFDAWVDARRAKAEAGDAPQSDLDTVMELATNWHGVDGEFNRENVATFLDIYHAAGRVIGETYARELTQYRLGN